MTVLVAYKTFAGATGEVAEFIASVLRDEGIPAEVCPLREVRDVRPYRAVILGAPVRQFRWEPDVVKFLQRHREALSRMPVAYFAVCLTMKEDTEANRCLVQSWMKPAFALLQPVSEADSGGKPPRAHWSKMRKPLVRVDSGCKL